MTAWELATILADEFHDWIDGDDWPVNYAREQSEPPGLWVEFASGRTFTITIEEKQ